MEVRNYKNNFEFFKGSVNEKNSEELIKQPDVDGFLVFYCFF